MNDSKRRSYNEIYDERKNNRFERKIDKLLQQVFEYGYYDNAPKWYWMSIKDTLKKVDDIIDYNPSELCINIITLVDFDEEGDEEINIELKEVSELNEEPILKICWKLLDEFFEKIEGQNLEHIHLGLIHELDNAFCRYNDEYI
jgi:hypothetical protein